MDDKQSTSRNNQHPIPQNFMDVEFKIIGDLTMRQFIYLVAFGGPAYLFYNLEMNPILKWPIVILLSLIAFVLVAVPIDDRGADEWIVNFIRAVYGVNQRVYKKRGEIPKAFTMKTVEFVQAGVIATTSTSNRRKVEEYIKGISKLEEKPDMEDFNFTARKFVETKTPLTVSSVTTNETKTISQTIAPEKPAYQEVVIASPLSKPEEVPIRKFEIKKPIITPRISEILPKKLSLITKKIPGSDVQNELRTSSAATPGRKFISFSKKEAEELILPIRGEKSLNIFDTTPIVQSSLPKKDIKTIAKELEEITKEAKKVYGVDTSFRTIPLEDNNSLNKITGMIIDEQNNPLANIDTQILDKDGNIIETNQTDSRGNFSFYNINPGEYQIKILNGYLYQLNFDIIKFNVTSFPYPSLKITGKK